VKQIGVVLALLAALGLSGCAQGDISGTVSASAGEATTGPTPSAEPEVSPSAPSVDYRGQTGKTALELLEAKHEVVTQGEGEMSYVTSIDGVEADPEGQFWAFYVNGRAAQVGAGGYVTQDSDLISWRLENM
jgi:hypothetical protein